jgi:hypothetical protein
VSTTPFPTSLPAVDAKSAKAVEAFVVGKMAAMYPHAGPTRLPRVFRDVETLFTGGHPDYSAVDLKYHDLEHTLQATVCIVELMEGRLAAKVTPRIDSRHFELAITSVLLHDCGYLKLRSDAEGTGAKYTFCHVLRSCAFAAAYLPALRANDNEIEAVLSAINCTGPANEVTRLNFRQPVERIIGCALGTADFLGQMAAADYPDELDILYNEFKESDDFLNVPPARRVFRSPQDLMARTPAFWDKFVRPKLETDYQGVYRFLARPYPGGPNPYIEAVERNIAEIRRRVAAAPVASTPSGNGSEHN